MVVISKREKQRTIISKMTLEEKTSIFWSIHLAYTRGLGPFNTISSEDVISKLVSIEEYLSSTKRLSKKVTSLLDDIIGVPSIQTKNRDQDQFDPPPAA